MNDNQCMNDNSWSWTIMTQRQEVMAERIVECMKIKRGERFNESEEFTFWQVRKITTLSTILEGLKINYTRRGINIDTKELMGWIGGKGLNKIKTMLNQGLVPLEMIEVLKAYPGIYWNVNEGRLELIWNAQGAENWGYLTVDWEDWVKEVIKMEALNKDMEKGAMKDEGGRLIQGWKEAFEEPCAEVRESCWKKAYSWIEKLEGEAGAF